MPQTHLPLNVFSEQGSLPYWLVLLRAPQLGPIRCQNLLAAMGKIENLFQANTTELTALGLTNETIKALRQPDWRSVEQDLKWLQADSRHSIVTWEDAHYPQLLREIPAPPIVLFIKGNPNTLAQTQLAVVGSRNPSHLGVEITQNWVAELATNGLTITSGLALGIDAAAHHSALAVGGSTIAVMGTGLKRTYPASNQALANKIFEAGGALISEFLLDTPPKAENFPRRNRIVSGLCLGTLVIEASIKSGSLITARLAAEQGREVFAVPGSVHNPLARGCHLLLRQGAKLVESVKDIFEELTPLAPHLGHFTAQQIPSVTAAPLDEAHRKLLECIAFEPTPWDIIVARSAKNVSELSVMLLQLELHGWIVSIHGGYMRVKP